MTALVCMHCWRSFMKNAASCFTINQHSGGISATSLQHARRVLHSFAVTGFCMITVTRPATSLKTLTHVCHVNVCTRHTHTHARPFNGPFSGTTQVSRYQKSKTNLDFTEQETVSGSGISWAICKFAPHSRQIAMPAPHHSVFYRPDALPAAQPTASKHWMHTMHIQTHPVLCLASLVVIWVEVGVHGLEQMCTSCRPCRVVMFVVRCAMR